MISTKGRYALRVMVDLAQQDRDGYIPLGEIASRQEISEKYLEIILKILVKEKLLKGLRGKGGGSRGHLCFDLYWSGGAVFVGRSSSAFVGSGTVVPGYGSVAVVWLCEMEAADKKRRGGSRTQFV